MTSFMNNVMIQLDNIFFLLKKFFLIKFDLLIVVLLKCLTPNKAKAEITANHLKVPC